MKKTALFIASCILIFSLITLPAACKHTSGSLKESVSSNSTSTRGSSESSFYSPSDSSSSDRTSQSNSQSSKDSSRDSTSSQNSTSSRDSTSSQNSTSFEDSDSSDSSYSSDSTQSHNSSSEQGEYPVDPGGIYDTIIAALCPEFEAFADRQKVTRILEVSEKGGSLIVYSLTEVYEKQDAGYLLTRTEKTLNTLQSGPAYDENTRTETTLSPGSYARPLSFTMADVAALNLDYMSEISFTFGRNSAEKIFGISPSDDFDNVTLTVHIDGLLSFGMINSITDYTIMFDTGEYTVSIFTA